MGFFGSCWSWITHHKVASGIIAGVAVTAIVVATIYTCGGFTAVAGGTAMANTASSGSFVSNLIMETISTASTAVTFAF